MRYFKCFIYCFTTIVIISIIIGIHVFQQEVAPPSLYETNASIRQRLKLVENELRNIRLQTEKISRSIRHFQNQSLLREKMFSKPIPLLDGPSTDYELTRRRLENEVQETWLFFNSRLRNLSSAAAANGSISTVLTSIERVLKQGFDHKRLLMRNVWRLAEVDGHGGWRRREGAALSRLLDTRLHLLQNPRTNCSARRTLACEIDHSCGFGCQMHTLAQCFTLAYGMQRTLLVSNTDDWYNLGTKGRDVIFKPISKICQYNADEEYLYWRGESVEDLFQNLLVEISPEKENSYLPMSVPKEFEARLTRLHGSPFVWWISRFLQYLMRENDVILRMYEKIERELKLEKPYVGIHVRRTDKLDSEASFHDLSFYVNAANEYLMTIELAQNLTSKRIYIASDDVSVLHQAKANYSHLEFYGNSSYAAIADNERDSNESLYSLLIDLHFLAKADFLVCTFSSTFCRTAYALMHKYTVDASFKYQSLDDVYFYAGRGIPQRVVIMDHKSMAPEEIDLVVGDQIQFAGNQWNGYSKGKNMRTQEEGLFPSHKVKEETKFVDFPQFLDEATRIRKEGEPLK